MSCHKICPLTKQIFKKGLCTSCGTCIGVCPHGALSWEKEKIVVDENKCVSCGLCYEVCAGKGFDYPFFLKKLFGKKHVSFDLGHLENIYKGYSLNPQIRGSSSSGGLVTQLLVYLLQTKKIDGAVVMKMNGLNQEVFIATTPEEIITSAQSKYCLFPTNQVLKAVLAFKGKVAYVGLPCQVQGLRMVMEKMPELKERITAIFSLFCGFNMKKEATSYLMKNAKLKDIQKIEYRAKERGQTGFRATDKTGKTVFFEKHGYAFLNPLCCPKRCLLCPDLTGEFSDASFGDAWEEQGGWTRVLVRRKSIEKWFFEMQEKGMICLKPSCPDDIFKTQKQLINYKKRGIGKRLIMSRHKPDFGMNISKEKGRLFYYIVRFFQVPFVRWSILRFPLKFYEKLSRALRDICKDDYEVIRYLFWGGVTVLFSFISYAVFACELDYRIANIYSIILTKIFAYLTNKFFVFRSKTKDFLKTASEVIRFVLSRAFSGIVDFLGLIFLVQCFGINDYIAKSVMIIIVTLLNYVLSKKIVFRKGAKNDG